MGGTVDVDIVVEDAPVGVVLSVVEASVVAAVMVAGDGDLLSASVCFVAVVCSATEPEPETGALFAEDDAPLVVVAVVSVDIGAGVGVVVVDAASVPAAEADEF